MSFGEGSGCCGFNASPLTRPALQGDLSPHLRGEVQESARNRIVAWNAIERLPTKPVPKHSAASWA
jgi:hypothetical protein